MKGSMKVALWHKEQAKKQGQLRQEHRMVIHQPVIALCRYIHGNPEYPQKQAVYIKVLKMGILFFGRRV